MENSNINTADDLFNNVESNLTTNVVYLKDVIKTQEYNELHEAVKINGEFYTKLRNVLCEFAEAHCKSKLGMKVGYTSFTSFYKGKDIELKATGLNNIAQTCGYNLMIVPIPDSIPTDDFNMLNKMVDVFLGDVEKVLNVEGNKSKIKNKPQQPVTPNIPKVNNTLLNTIKQQSSGEADTVVGNLNNNTTSDVIKNIGADDFNINDMMKSIETASNTVVNTVQEQPEQPNLDILNTPNTMEDIIDTHEDDEDNIADISGLSSISGLGDIDQSFLMNDDINIIDNKN